MFKFKFDPLGFQKRLSVVQLVQEMANMGASENELRGLAKYLMGGMNAEEANETWSMSQDETIASFKRGGETG